MYFTIVMIIIIVIANGPFKYRSNSNGDVKIYLWQRRFVIK